ncbi:hypothetical protein H4582DRAFT_2014257, partial [Lactarius indigo]
PVYPIKVQVCPCSRRVLNKTCRRHRLSGLGLPKSGAVIDQTRTWTRTQRSGSKNLSIECSDTLLSHASHGRQSKLCWMNTKIWIKEFLNRTFGYLSIARFSWMTIKIDDKCSGVGHDKGQCTVTKDLGPSSISTS